MAGNLNLSLIISAVDRVTAPVRRMQASIDRSLSPLRRFGRSVSGLGQAAGLPRIAGAASNLGSALGTATREAGALGVKLAAAGGAAAWLFKSQFIDTAAEFERLSAVLETVEGSAAKAREAMRWASDFAATTPFELGEVTAAFVKLRAYGVDPTNGTLRTLGDTAAAMGKSMDQALEALVDAQTGEFERLKEFGIKAQVAGDRIRFAYTNALGEQAYKVVKKGNAEVIRSTLEAIWNERYAGAMKRQSETFGGMTSNLSDQWERFKLMVMGSGPFDFIKDRLKSLLDTVDAMAASGRLQELADSFGGKLLEGLKQTWQAGVAVAGALAAIGAVLSDVAETVGGWENLISGLAAVLAGKFLVSLVVVAGAVWNVAAAFLATPIGWLTLGLVGIAGAAGMITGAFNPLATFFPKLWGDIVDVVGGTVTEIVARIDALAERIRAAVDLLVSLPDRVREVWAGITEAIGGTIAEMIARVVDFPRQLMAGLAGGVRGLADNLPDFLREQLGIDGLLANLEGAGQAATLGAPASTLGAGARDRTEVGGEMVVRFDNAPPGTRVTSLNRRGPMDIEVDAGLMMVAP